MQNRPAALINPWLIAIYFAVKIGPFFNPSLAPFPRGVVGGQAAVGFPDAVASVAVARERLVGQVFGLFDVAVGVVGVLDVLPGAAGLRDQAGSSVVAVGVGVPALILVPAQMVEVVVFVDAAAPIGTPWALVVCTTRPRLLYQSVVYEKLVCSPY
jgi:hypothetical protein